MGCTYSWRYYGSVITVYAVTTCRSDHSPSCSWPYIRVGVKGAPEEVASVGQVRSQVSRPSRTSLWLALLADEIFKALTMPVCFPQATTPTDTCWI